MKNGALPHEGVLTRLGPSKIHGVGVFAIVKIPEGSYIFADDDEEMIWLSKSQLKDLPKAFKKLYEDFCISKGGKYGCPRSFNRLTPAWYLNDSDHPNVAADENYNFLALRDIEEGEELTVDYDTYSERA